MASAVVMNARARGLHRVEQQFGELALQRDERVGRSILPRHALERGQRMLVREHQREWHGEQFTCQQRRRGHAFRADAHIRLARQHARNDAFDFGVRQSHDDLGMLRTVGGDAGRQQRARHQLWRRDAHDAFLQARMVGHVSQRTVQVVDDLAK
jgi:hypothetical protein